MNDDSTTALRRHRSGRQVLAAIPPARENIAEPVAAAPVEEFFVCTSCHRDMEMIERSRVVIGRCRACV
jgi:hypothetical protein